MRGGERRGGEGRGVRGGERERCYEVLSLKYVHEI